MRVLLIYPNARKELIGYGDLGAIAEPLALEYLAAGAKLDSHEVEILDLRLHQDDLDPTLLRFNPDIIGLTGYSMHVPRILSLCRRAKELLPNCRTIVGGHHATLLPADFFEPQIDFIVVGEGVRPLRALLQNLDTGNAQPIAGVWARTDDAFTFGGEQQDLTIDDIPLPDRKVALADRNSYFIDWMRPIALLRTTVGCPYRCSFCSLWKIMDGRYYKRDVQRVADELATIREECVFLVDDEPFVNGPRMLMLAQAIKEAHVKKRYFAYCRIDTLLREREMMTAWRDIGLERLFIGIEAISADELGDYNKRLNVAQIEDGLLAAKNYGIEVFAGFIVNTNYTQREFKQLVRFIEHHKVSYPSFTVLTPLPGTAALTNFEGVTELQPNGRPNWELFDLQHPVTPTVLPQEVFRQEYKNLYRVFSGQYSPHRSQVKLRDRAGAVIC
jgi:radical SAM superfamily enzyme YgiQ (UPF0313 family)